MENSMEPRKIKEYEFDGKPIGEIWLDGFGKREFKPALSEFEVVDVVRELDSATRIHMRSKTYGIHRALQHYGHSPDDYIDDGDVILHVTEMGCGTLTELNHSDFKTWELVHQRGLEKMLVPELKPAD